MSDELPYCEAELRRARERIAELEAAIACADELLEMGMRELAQNELRKVMENDDRRD